MGLMDFWKKRSGAATGELGGNDPLGLGPHGSPRCCHYAMAHYALRMFALKNPLQCLAVLASPKAQQFLADVLEAVAKDCATRGERPDFTAADLKIHTQTVAEYPVAIVEFPTPVAITEAFMTGVVLLAKPADGEERARTTPGRYFTLEKGFSFESQEDRTVLGEWTTNAHSNYGTDPAATVEAFLVAIEGHLTPK
jgi:hypothetical protein